MGSRIRKFFGSRHHRSVVRHALWHTLARLGGTGLHTLPVSRRWIDIRRMAMPLRGLSPELAGIKIVQISDLHYSPVVRKTYLEQYFDFINELEPDLVLVTGDLITGGYMYAARISRLLNRLEPRLGVVCTFGNHDYSMWGKRPGEAKKRGDYLEASLEGRGLIVLRNETLVVTRDSTCQFKPGVKLPAEAWPVVAAAGRADETATRLVGTGDFHRGALVIVGLDDEWTGQIDPASAFDQVPLGAAVVCLNHNPINARELLKYRWQWMLAGHTHGRQLGEKGLSKAVLSHKRREFVQGYYNLGEAGAAKHLYVNRGLSYGQRAHVWCRPEVTVFKLTVDT